MDNVLAVLVVRGIEHPVKMNAMSYPLAEPEGNSAPRPPSLWGELADGSAGPVVRTAVSFGLAPLLAGLAFVGSYALAEWVPAWSYRWNGLVRPTDELVGAMLTFAGVGYLLALMWVWTRGRRPLHEFWKAGVVTAVVAVVTTVLCIMIAESPAWRGGEEVLVGGLVCLGGSGAILAWVQAGRKYARRQLTATAADGALDLRCPSCGYRMVGLHESRCPECGTTYTLDELLARQPFAQRGRAAGAPLPPPPPPPVPTAAGRGEGPAAAPLTLTAQ